MRIDIITVLPEMIEGFFNCSIMKRAQNKGLAEIHIHNPVSYTHLDVYKRQAMDFFNEFYSVSDLAIVHGIRRIDKDSRYTKFLSINTIIRSEIIGVENVPTNNIYCVLGGGTVNVGQLFVDSTIAIGQLCQKVASLLPQYTMHIVCSSQNIFNVLNRNSSSENVVLHDEIIPAEQYYCCLLYTSYTYVYWES